MIRKKKYVPPFGGFSKWVQFIFARLVLWLLARLPLKASYALGEGFGWILWKFLKRRRATVRQNLEIVNAWMVAQGKSDSSVLSEAALKGLVREVFLRSGANLISGFALGNLSIERQMKHIEVEGVEALESCVESGRGLIVLLAHMGPWESLSSLGPLFKTKYNLEITLGAMYRPLNNNYLETWYRAQRERLGTHMFSRRDSFRDIFKFLKAGGLLAILADQRIHRGEESEFFGETALTTPLLKTLVRGSNSEVFSMALHYDKSCKLKLKFRSVNLGGASTRAEYASLTNREVERMLSEDITGGFWLHRRFVK